MQIKDSSLSFFFPFPSQTRPKISFLGFARPAPVDPEPPMEETLATLRRPVCLRPAGFLSGTLVCSDSGERLLNFLLFWCGRAAEARAPAEAAGGGLCGLHGGGRRRGRARAAPHQAEARRLGRRRGVSGGPATHRSAAVYLCDFPELRGSPRF